MRVLQLINSLILAGAEVLVRELAPRLRQRGIETEVGVLKYLKSPLEASLRDEAVPLFRFPGGGMYSPLQVLPLALRLPRYDLVHVHLFPAQTWAAAACALSRCRVPMIVTEHNPDNGRRKHPVLRALDRWTYKHYRAVACNSQATAAALAAWLPETEKKIRVIPNGVPLERFTAAEPALPAALGVRRRPILISVARMQPQKDHATLLRATARLPQAELVLVGDGELRPELRSLASRLGIAERVHFLGRRPDVPNLLAMADVFVHATHSDGFGIAAVEAMASGVPVIASRVPGLTEVMGEAGITVPAGDERALAEAIAGVLADEQRCEEMRRAGRCRAAEFGMERCADAYVNLYESALQG